MEKQRITLEEALKDAPELIQKLRKQHGNNVRIGHVWNKPHPLLQQEPAGTTCATILVNGREIGIYEKDWGIDGTYAQRFNNKSIN